MAGHVAVVVTTHNYGKYLEDCLRSLAAQSRLPEHVVIVDDGSTDDTPAVIARLIPELSASFELTVITHAGAHGLAAALNEGIRATDAEFVAHVDADDVCLPRYLEAMLAALDTDEGASYAYPRMQLTGAEEGVYRTFPFHGGRLLFEGNYIPNVALIRRTVFERTDGFRQLATHLDWDFWLTLLESGHSGVLVDEILYEWRRHDGAMTYQPLSRRLRLRANILWRHRRLAVRMRGELLPWTWQAARRRLRARDGETRSPSGWLED